ncbi:hypothetical protein M1N79_01595 [Dehalococcoidia bacterium]|nr:hypothetical protein [Dehalococcoidia bacterium]
MDRIVNMMNQMGGKSVMKKKLRVTGLAMFVVLATIFSVVPGIMETAQAGNVVTAFSSNPDFYSQPVEIKDLEGVVYGADEELDTPKTDFNAELSRVNLVYQEDGLRFSAVLTYDGSQYEVFAKGVLYPLISGGIHDSKRLVAELRTQNEFSIVQFKVRNVGNEGVAKLRISIENTITGDLFHFRGSINTSAFDRILGYANRRVEMLTN